MARWSWRLSGKVQPGLIFRTKTPPPDLPSSFLGLFMVVAAFPAMSYSGRTHSIR